MLTRIFCLAIFCFCASLSAMSNDEAESKIFPYEYEMRDLENGLRIIVIPTDFPNIVALQIPVQTGSRNEVELGKSGFAHFFEHMMFRGTEKYSAEAYNKVLKNTGAGNNAYTTDDFTNYYITFSKEDLEKIMDIESDRFMNLKYSLPDFQTEAKAVLGEYNKNSASPTRKIREAQRNAAFKKHTYKHTTMGFLKDIEDMPNQYDYSLEFFDRYYRPERVTIILAGDLDVESTFTLVEKYWGSWKRGNFVEKIPQEPPSETPVYEHVEWETETLPWMTVAFHGPAFSEAQLDMAALDMISSIAFSSSSPLYQKLVVREQKVDRLFTDFADHKDPYLVTIFARIKDIADAWYVRDEILKTFAGLRTDLVSAQRLSEIKSFQKYDFALRLDNSQAIAEALVSYVQNTRDPETVNRVYRLYDALKPEDIQEMANRYFVDKNLIVTTLSHTALPQVASLTGSVDALADVGSKETAKVNSVIQMNNSPVLNFRILFNVGAASDPKGQAGLAQLTASMITGGGSKDMTYEQIQKTLYPIAADFSNQVDKEMTVFTGTTHIDNLNTYYEVISGQLLRSAWDENDFKRVKNNLINSIKVSLRENNEEELGKEVLYESIYQGHPYGSLNLGHVAAIEKLTLEDVQNFYNQHYTQANLVLGLAGNFPESFVQKINGDLAMLPAGTASSLVLPPVPRIHGFEATIIQKKAARAVAVSFGFPIEVTRSHPDFAALWLAQSFLGQHRSTGSHLFQRIREVRGMNYGDYAYIEYFPRGMFQMEPDANLCRQQQIFQIWIRPVESNNNAHFATRVAMFELQKLIDKGISQADFESTQNFLTKYVNVLTKTQDKQLGYAMDSKYYNQDEFNSSMATQLKKLTRGDVNRAIRKHLQTKNLKFVFITSDAEDMKSRLVSNMQSPRLYKSEKPKELLDEDKIIQDYKLDFKKDKVTIVPVEEVFVN